VIKALVAVPLLVLAVAVAGCTAPQPDNADDGVLSIVASTNVYGDIAQTVGGGDVEVVSIIDDPAQDPHQFEANARVQLALSTADIVIVNGGGYDDFATQMLEASGNDDATVITAVDEAGRDVSANEHVWYDYATTAAVAQRVGAALRGLDPAGADAYDENVDLFLAGIESLDLRIADLKPQVEGAGVVITEPVPLYLLEALGLENLTPPEFSEAIEEDSDVPPALLQSVLNLLGDGSAALVVYNEQTGGPQTDAILDIAGENRIPAIGVTETLPTGVDYIGWQAGYLDVLQNGLLRD
jgi:zinc/manganese transport system substrate-binding protein